jgi:hypothetical protein
MDEIISLLKNLYTSGHAFGRRFMFFSLSIIATALCQWLNCGGAVLFGLFFAVVFWIKASVRLPNEKKFLLKAKKNIDNFDFDGAEAVLNSIPPFIGIPSKIARLELLSNLKTMTGDHLTAYEALIQAERLAVLPVERESVKLAKGYLLFQMGNHQALHDILSGISVEQIHDQGHRFTFQLLKSISLEVTGLLVEAKKCLEEAVEMAESSSQRILAYNNLARLEEAQGHGNNSRSYYEKSWIILEKEPVPRFIPIVGHNLLIKYAQDGNIPKCKELLGRYKELVAHENKYVYLEFINDQTHLARQLGDKILLLESYAAIKQILPTMTQKQQLSIAVSELRMRLSDKVDFAAQFKDVFIMYQTMKNAIDEESRIHALQSLWMVYKQSWQILPSDLLGSVIPIVVQDLLSMEEFIDQYLREIPPKLPLLRDRWLGFKIELAKLTIDKFGEPVSGKLLGRLFDIIAERQLIWKEKGNYEKELDALIIYCDEYVTYSQSLSLAFLQDYRNRAITALKQAGEVIIHIWPRPGMHRFAFQYAYFLWKIAGDKENSIVWLSRFESIDLSLRHYMPWMRSQYDELKNVLG